MKDHRTFEITAVVITALGKFIFYDLLHQQFVFIVLMFAFWGIYVLRRVRRHPEVLQAWGFRTDTFLSVLRQVTPFGLVAVLCCFVLGYARGTLNMHWHLIPILLLYPIFGTLQQFLLMALLAGNLQRLHRMRDSVIILLTALLFGLLHYPYWWLVLGTFTLALLYTFLYLRNRNLYVLGLFHGWLGGIFYYTVVDKDPFLEVFGPILNSL